MKFKRLLAFILLSVIATNSAMQVFATEIISDEMILYDETMDRLKKEEILDLAIEDIEYVGEADSSNIFYNRDTEKSYLNDDSLPIFDIDFSNSCGAITETGDLYMWGENEYGQVGNGSVNWQKEPAKIMSKVASLKINSKTCGAITENRDLYMWGDNRYIQIAGGAVPQLTPIKVLSDVRTVNIGVFVVGAIMENGDLYMWGDNRYGQVGCGDETVQPTPTKVLSNVQSVIIEGHSVGAITKNGDLYMWGDNTYGQIGNGTKKQQKTPIKVLSKVMKFSLNAYNSGAITENGDLYMWGDNASYQIGNGTEDVTQTSPVKILSNIKSLSLNVQDFGKYGRDCGCGAITENGDLYMWGENGSYDQMGNGTEPTKVLSNIRYIDITNGNVGAISNDDDLYMWGSNLYGEAGNGTTDAQKKPIKIMSDVKCLAVENEVTSVITNNDELYVWGRNYAGKHLGIGDSDMVVSTIPNKILSNVKVAVISSGTSGAIMENGDLYVWGAGVKGDTGFCDSDDQSTPIKVLNIGSISLKDEITIYSNICYFSKWDAENQIVYFGPFDYTGSRVTEETDISFLQKIDKLIGKYVLVQTKSNEDGLVGPDTLISITELDTQKGVVTTFDGTSIVIDGVKYALPEDLTVFGISEGDSVVYHISNGKLAGLQILKTEKGILNYWNADTGELKISSDEFTVNEKSYVLSELADDETIEFLGISGGKETSVKYVLDNHNLIYHVEWNNNNETYPEFDGWGMIDEWRFKNYSVNKIPLKKEDYNALTYNMSNSQKEMLDSIIEDKHGGQCYGMAVTSFLAKHDVLSLDTIEPGLENLYDSKKNSNSKSVIGYYYLNQFTNGAITTMESFEKLSLKQQLDKMDRTPEPYVLCFGRDGWGAHAVVVIATEKGSWEYHGNVYNTRALIYDSNYGWRSTSDRGSYIYYNSETLDWELPDYYNRGPSSENGGYLILASNEIGVFNSLDIEKDRNGYSAWLRNRSGSGFEVMSSNKNYSINGQSSDEYDDLRIYYDIGYNEESFVTPTINVEFKEACEYTVIPDNEGETLDITILYPDYYAEASAETYESISLKQNGGISASGLEGEYELSMTSNENMEVLDWYTVDLEGSCATEISTEMTTEGILINADNLSDLKVTGTSSEDTIIINISSEEQSILVTENDNGDIAVREDDDNDGIYEKDISIEIVMNRTLRISGEDRYETSYKVADALKEELDVEKFDSVIIATGKNFADALAGSYLSVVKEAPILLTNGKADNIAKLHEYIKENVITGGTIYILGGDAAVPKVVESINGYVTRRLSGDTRYNTNIEILKEAGIAGDAIIVATGKSFADSLSASATKLPILLVRPGNTLNAEQKEILEGMKNIYIVGGEGAVDESYAKELETYGTVERVYGASRYDTSVAIANTFFGNVDTAVAASGKNFPDGLCGGSFAAAMNAPLILTADGKATAASEYIQGENIGFGYVLGGNGALSDETVMQVFQLKNSDEIILN